MSLIVVALKPGFKLKLFFKFVFKALRLAFSLFLDIYILELLLEALVIKK